MQRRREQLKERLAVGRQRHRTALRIATGSTNLCDGPSAADHRDVVADRAARAVECRAESFLRSFDFEEIVQAETKLFEIDRGDAEQRLAETLTLCVHAGDPPRERGYQQNRRRADRLHRSPRGATTLMVPRMKLWPAPHIREHSKV